MTPSPRRLAIVAVLCLAALVAASPARAEEPPAPAAPPAAPAAPVAAPQAGEPKITLLEPGAEPRTKLRYAFAMGEPQRTAMRMEISQDIEVDGQKTPAPGLPSLGMAVKSTVEAVHADGSATVLWEISDMKVEAGDGVPAENLKEMEEMFAQMRFKVRSEMTVRGYMHSSRIELPSDVTGPVKQVLEQMAEQMKDSIGETAALLPEEAVGTGASWKVELSKKTPQGVQVHASPIATVTSLADGKASIESKVTMDGPEQDFALPNLPAGKPAHLHSMSGGGTAKITFDPKMVLPDTEMTIQMDMKMSMDPGNGTTLTMVIKQTIGMAIRTKP